MCHTYCSQLVKIRIFCRWQEALYSAVMDNKVIDDMGYTVYIYIQSIVDNMPVALILTVSGDSFRAPFCGLFWEPFKQAETVP